MKVDLIPPAEGQYNLKNYDEAYANFNWADVEKQFSWYETGKVNMRRMRRLTGTSDGIVVTRWRCSTATRTGMNADTLDS